MRTLREIHEAIDAMDIRLEGLEADIAMHAENAGRAEAAYKSTFARERLKARAESSTKITTDVAEDKATVATEALQLEHLMCQAKLTASRDALRSSMSRMDSLRTQAASFRAAGG